MLTRIRWKLAAFLARKAHECIDKGGYKNIKKGLKYFKWSVEIVPPSDHLRAVGERLRAIAEEERGKLLEDQG